MKISGNRSTTRVFKAGNSLAVRIPRQFGIEEGEVTIEERAGGWFITNKRGDWASFFDGTPVDFPSLADDLRDERSPRDVDLGDLLDAPAKLPRKKPAKQ